MNESASLTDKIVALLPRLRRFALTLTRKQDESDDLVQATVERALRRLDSWKEDTRLDSWMFKIMQNLWIDQIRSRRSKGSEAPLSELDGIVGAEGEAEIDARSTLRATLQAIMRLPEEQRAVLLLVVVEDLSYREAADVLEIPIGTIMSRLSRARLSLESLLSAQTPTNSSMVRQ